MILEGLVTTLDADGAPRISAMGAQVDRSMTWLCFRPFVESRTFANLQRTRQGIFHVTDDVELIARAAIHRFEQLPTLIHSFDIDGKILADVCRWYAFRVVNKDEDERFDGVQSAKEGPAKEGPAREGPARESPAKESQSRAFIRCDIVAGWRNRDFFGLSRAMHAVVEAAILATRVAWLDSAHVQDEMQRLAPLVEKTGGAREHRAFALLQDFIGQSSHDLG